LVVSCKKFLVRKRTAASSVVLGNQISKLSTMVTQIHYLGQVSLCLWYQGSVVSCEKLFDVDCLVFLLRFKIEPIVESPKRDKFFFWKPRVLKTYLNFYQVKCVLNSMETCCYLSKKLCVTVRVLLNQALID
jgi:hypothetical protein